MKPVLKTIRFIWAHERRALLRGLALSFAVLVAGIALLGLSGWFIIASAAAGLIGAGQVFDVFRPAAGVRFLAIGRTAARYGERVLSHDATLRALARLRVQVLGHLTRADFKIILRLRGAQMLNRLTSDIDALDGITIRLIMPVIAGCATLLLAFAMLWWLVGFGVASFVVATMILASVFTLRSLARKTYAPSAQFDAATTALRSGLVDHLRGRDVLTFAGALAPRAAELNAHMAARKAAQQGVMRHEVRAGLSLSIASAVISAGALILGGILALNGAILPAQAALGFFATLALFEVIAPLRRGLAEIATIRAAATRLEQYLDPLPAPRALASKLDSAGLTVHDLQVGFDGPSLAAPVSFVVAPGQTLALVGASGAGKTTLLNTLAGLLPPVSGSFALLNTPDAAQSAGALPTNSELRQNIGYLQQRSALISGSIRDGLSFGARVSDTDLEEVLRAVGLWDAVVQKGGLDARLGEAGQGLSGGQRKRLCLARVMLRRPAVLLLDEVTEGLDRDTALKVLTGLRMYLPHAAIIMAAHRTEEREFADMHVQLCRM